MRPITRRRAGRVSWWVGAGALVPLTSGCALGGAMRPAGPAAADIAFLWWVMLAVSAVIYLLVVGLLVGSALRRPRRADTARTDRRFVVAGGLVLPAVVLGGLLVLNIETLVTHPRGGDMVVEIVGHQYWWEVRYTDPAFVSANELHIPVGTDVQVTLHSADVNHSFWVPELAGKRDLIPGRQTAVTLRADEPGTYRGQCAEFCGIQHANMGFYVIAEPPDAFEEWVAQASGPAAEPTGAASQRGQETFADAGCAACHTVRGTDADGDVGPDLTHFASRLTIGAGAAPNARGHLGGWVANAQSIKPGNEMPPVEIEADRLADLLTYLEGLE